MSNFAPGSIWRECDPRKDRFVRIERHGFSNSIFIRTVVKIDGRWEPARGSRISQADLSRFNGAYGGYAFHEGATNETP